jgi:hypothetical protein
MTVAGVDDAELADKLSALDCPAGLQPLRNNVAKPIATLIELKPRWVFNFLSFRENLRAVARAA